SFWLRGRLWNDLCRRSRLGRHAQAAVKQGHEPYDGANHGRFSNCLDLLRAIDCVATRDRLEHGRHGDQFSERWGVPSFRPLREESSTPMKHRRSPRRETAMTAEHRRLEEARTQDVTWKKWGPYLSERQWGTVREDYSEGGDAWNYFSHDQARSRAYRWGEDGLAGISDDHQLLCFSLALWNGKDPILKERLFGLTNAEGNHGEDVKEYYFYLDNTPTHSYMKYLYKYPQRAYPYDDLVRVNRQRSRDEFEYELMDTGIFADDRYFDVFVEYAKESASDILVKITAWNHGPEAAPITLLPTLWFRNTWSNGKGDGRPM